MKMNGEKFLQRPSVFWLSIAGVAATGIIAFNNLANRVDAMTAREQINKDQFYDLMEKVDQIAVTQQADSITLAEIQKDIEYIIIVIAE